MKKIINEWRKYLQESYDDKQIPAKVYYGTEMSQLPSIRDNGIVNLPNDSEIDADKVGVPVCTSPEDARAYGNVVLEIDGESLRNSMQYESIRNSQGCRVKMKDSSSLSGSGIDKMVDALGTNIPFDAVTAAIFSGTPNLNQLKGSGFGNIGLYSFPLEEGQELKTLHEPPERQD